RSWFNLMAGKTVFSVAAMPIAFVPEGLLTFVTPFAWLLLIKPGDEDGDTQTFPRGLLCTLTVMQTLYAYPIAGSQRKLIQILLFLTVAVCLGDSLRWLTRGGQGPAWLLRRGRSIAIAALLVIALVYVGTGLYRYRLYRSDPALDLPG